MAEWERTERHEVVITGPKVVDAVELMAELNQALSDYWLVAGVQPHSEVPRGAITVSALGGVLAVHIEHRERAVDQPVEAPDEAVPGDG